MEIRVRRLVMSGRVDEKKCTAPLFGTAGYCQKDLLNLETKTFWSQTIVMRKKNMSWDETFIY